MKPFLRARPFSLALAAVTLLVGLATGPVAGPSAVIEEMWGTGYEQVAQAGRWWTPLTSLFLTDSLAELLAAVVALVLVVGAAERVMGTGRTVVAFVATTVVGTLLGIGFQAIGVDAGELWADHVREVVTLDPLTAVAGTIMTASAFAGALWRRRIRVFTFSTAAVFLLYSGQPSDVYRMAAAFAGLALGMALSRRRLPNRWVRSSHHEARVLLAVFVAITAIGPAITVLSGRRFGVLAPLGLLLTDARPAGAVDACRIESVTRDCLEDLTLLRLDNVGPVLLTILPLLALLVAAFGLARGRRLAVWLAISVNVALAALGGYYYGFLPVSGQPYVLRMPSPHYWEITVSLVASVLVPLLIAVLLAGNLSHFSVRASQATVRRFLTSLAVALLGLSALYVGLGWLVRDQFTPNVTLANLLADVPERFIPIGFLRIERVSFLPTDFLSTTLYYWIGPCFWVVLIAGALLSFRDPGSRAHTEGLPRVRELLRAGGGGSLAQLATWPGNTYWFSADGRAAVAYRVINGIAITTSEPIGDSEATRAAVPAFARFCDDYGWTPVFYAVHDSLAPTLAQMGFSMLPVGEETVIRPSQWKTTGKRWQDVRSSISRAERVGVRSEWTRFVDLSPDHARQILDISEQWMAEKDLPEMGFTLGGVEELRDPEVGLMIACDSDDRITGVTSWMPSYRDGVVIGWTLDFMRRTPDGMNGIMEFLIARSAEQFKADGIEFLSLSTAPLAQTGPGENDEATATTRIMGWLGRTLEPVYGFQSLFNFKRKFQPEFHTMLMAYPDPIALPAIGVALARAYVPSMSLRQSAQFVRSLA